MEHNGLTPEPIPDTADELIQLFWLIDGAKRCRKTTMDLEIPPLAEIEYWCSLCYDDEPHTQHVFPAGY